MSFLLAFLSYAMMSFVLAQSATVQTLDEETLNIAEHKLLADVRSCSTSSFVPGDDRLIRASVLESLCRGKYILPPYVSVICVDGAHISDSLNLSLLNSSMTLAFENCVFDEVVVMNATSAYFISFRGSTLSGGLQGDGIRTTCMLSFSNCICKGTLRMPEARIGGQLNLSGANLDGGNGKHALLADGSTIAGGAFFLRLTAVGPISLLGVHVGQCH